MAGILEGKAVVITGGGTGIGEAIARAFAAEGARILIAGRRREALDTVAKETGARVQICDVADEASVQALFQACDRAFGRLDVLVNNAGVTGPVANAEDMDMAEWDDCLAINVRGVILCIKHAIPLLKRQGGSIVNMSSRMGIKGYPMRSPYTASKFAVIGITQAVAHEVGPLGIRVNALCPGAVAGALMDRVIAARVAKEGRPAADIIKTNYTDVAALRKWVDPAEVASVALFLASDAASAITAESIMVDAGRM
jgi:NAD(P)-dependent dehydrogenase (short-subunit alcohol dehydrogenase family)